MQEVDGEEALRRVFDDAVYDYHVASQSGVQRTGFAYRSGLRVALNPDYAALDVGGVRVGTDLTVIVNDRPLRLLSVHPGVTVDQVLEASGCALHVEGDVPETRTPSTEELLVIREVLDPKGLRFKEVPVPKEETA